MNQDEELLLACETDSLSKVEDLLKNGANPNCCNEDGRTPLMYASRYGHADIVKKLLNSAAKVDAVDNHLWTASHYAAVQGRLEVIGLLKAHGANFNLKNKEATTPLDLMRKSEPVHRQYMGTVQRAMKDGVTEVMIIKVLIIGPPGSGKTGIKHLLLNLSAPSERNSTPLAARTARAISLTRIRSDGSGDVTWEEIESVESYINFIAQEIKLLDFNQTPAINLPFLLRTLDNLSVTDRSAVPPPPPPTKQEVTSYKSAQPFSVDSTLHAVVQSMFNTHTLSDKPQTKQFVHLIDSGGQPSFVSLIPAFIRGATVNVVTSKLNYHLDEKLPYEYVKDDCHLRQPTKLERSQIELLKEFVRSLSSVKYSKKSGAETMSRFLIIGTHADKHVRLFMESLASKNQRLKKSLGNLRSMCIEANTDGDIIHPVNTRIKKGRSKVGSNFRRLIMDACSNASVRIPTRWYIFELEVGSMAKKKGRAVLGLVECLKIGMKLNMDEDEVMFALVFLDHVAVFLYFKGVIPHLVFTDSQAILNEVTEIVQLGIIDDYIIPSQYPNLFSHMALVRRLREQGLFNRKLVELVCDEYRVSVEGKCCYTVDDFLAILKHLLIIAQVSIDGEELFFIPSILPSNKNVTPLKGKLVPLILLCSTKVIPLGMFSALVVALLDDVLFVLHEIKFSNAVSFECKEGGIMLLVEAHGWLVVHFNGNPSVAFYIREAIKRAIKKVCKQRQLDTKQIVFNDGFWCPFKPKCHKHLHPCKVNYDKKWLTCSVNPEAGSGSCTGEKMLAWFTTRPETDTAVKPSSPPTTDLTNRSSSLAPTGQPSSEPPDQIATGSTEPSSFNFSPSARSLTDLPQPANIVAGSAEPLTSSILVKELLPSDYNRTEQVDSSSSSAKPFTQLSHSPEAGDVVSMFQFMETVATKKPDKWHTIGIALGLSPSQLNAIEGHRRGDPLKCFSDVYECWQQQATPQCPANWTSLVAALNSDLVGETSLACFIQKEFM